MTRRRAGPNAPDGSPCVSSEGALNAAPTCALRAGERPTRPFGTPRRRRGDAECTIAHLSVQSPAVPARAAGDDPPAALDAATKASALSLARFQRRVSAG